MSPITVPDFQPNNICECFFCIQELGSWAESISQNHIAAEVGSHIWSSSSPMPCSRQGHLQQVAEGYVLLNFYYLQGWTLHIPRAFRGTHSIFKYPGNTKAFSYFKWNFLYFNLCLLPPLLSLNASEKNFYHLHSLKTDT